MNAQMGYKLSYLWRILLASREIVCEVTVWRIENGKSIAVGTDKWIEANQYETPIFILSVGSEVNIVNELIDHSMGRWKTEEIESLFLPEVKDHSIVMLLSVNGGEYKRGFGGSQKIVCSQKISLPYRL